MNNTVQKLMELADDYALWSSESQADDARKRLQDELTRLLTPPSKPEAREYKPCTVCGGAFELESNGYNTFPRCNQCGHVPCFDRESNDIAAEASPEKSAAYAKWSADNAAAHAAKVTEAIAKALHGNAGESK